MLIYLVRNRDNGKIYVGKWQGKSWKQRWAMHVAHAQSFASGKKHYFHSAIRSHGPNAFAVSEIDYAETKEQLRELETFYILSLCSYSPSIGYNMTMGGEGGGPWTEERKLRARGRKLSPETIEKIKAAKLGEKNPFFGKTHTPANRDLMGMARRGKITSPDHRAKIAKAVSGERNGNFGKQPWLGRTHTASTKRKISALRKEMFASDPSLSDAVSQEMKRNWETPETRARMLAGARKGSKMSSMTQFGHPVSEETKRKISEAAKARHAARRQAAHDVKDVRGGGPMMVVPPMYPNATS